MTNSIQSLRDQTYEVDEILLVDDGSTHKAPNLDILQNPKIKIIRNESNRGRGYSRNLAIKNSSSEFILTLDATNFVEKEFIEKALLYFDKTNIAAVSVH